MESGVADGASHRGVESSRCCDANEKQCSVRNRNPLNRKQQGCGSNCQTAKHRLKQTNVTAHTATPFALPKPRNMKQKRWPTTRKNWYGLSAIPIYRLTHNCEPQERLDTLSEAWFETCRLMGTVDCSLARWRDVA